ncbi:glycosyltransferase [Oceanisphaera sp. IT1-181]|uniref:glycosyltransferase n=1 Tax=Oceanisphaera sp. IT1-181 TaxID=3081199 RepID=UPI0029CA643B|nr:glycosyltransferase [Oceanisphaera sp. IT1-181]
MNSIKVINIFTSLDFGGVESHACIINRSEKYSCEYTFVAISHGGKAGDEIRSHDGEVIILNKNTHIPSFTTIYTLYGLLKKLNPDVVHTRGAEANFHGLIAAWLARVPVRIGEEIGIPSHGFKAKLFFKFAYLFAIKVIGISKAVTKWLIESGEVPAHKAVKIYNPVLIPKPRCEEDIPKSRLRIGFVGRLEPVKNPLALVEALAIVVRKGIDAELWFVGDGSQKQALLDLASTHGISERVILHGFQGKPDDFVRQCHLYVQPSISEGFGLALVEAMGCAVPVIATAVGGAPEIINNGKTGWLIERTDPETLAYKIVEVVALPAQELIDIGKRGRESVKTRFEPSSYMSELENLYMNELERANN